MNVGKADFDAVRVGASLVVNTAKNAIRIASGLHIPTEPAEGREAQANAVLEAINAAEEAGAESAVIADHLMPVAGIGIGFELSKVKKAREDQQTALQITDTKPLDRRVAQLERLAKDFGVQKDLGLDESPAGESAPGVQID